MCAVSPKVEVYIVSCGRYISVDVCLCVGAVVGSGMNVYLFFFPVPVHVSVEHAHSSVFKQEFVDVEFCVSVKFSERSYHVSPSRRLAAEAYGMEVDEVEHVVHVHRLEIY